ncbi:tetratricopeptide repeat protein [Candidatus Peregrinibacteria bacterium]|nr:tetratricopeptide repeat protein [Candidatus Peregrinibacteria bacterium]
MAEGLSRWARILGCAAVILLCAFAAFGRSLWQGFAAIDDAFLVYGNLAIRGITLSTLKLAFTTYDPELYIPGTLVSFQVNYLIAGLHPWIYHCTNLALHAANAFLVFVLADRVRRRSRGNEEEERGNGGSMFPAIAAAVLFAVHPLHTEAVVWIAGRKDLLSTFFFLLACIAYISSREGHRRWYAASMAFFLLALLAKVMAITLPAVLLAYDLLIERRRGWSLLLQKIPHIVLSMLFLIIAIGGKERILSGSSLLPSALVAARSVVLTLQKLVFPVGLSPFYELRASIAVADPRFLFPLVILLMLIGLLAWLWVRWPACAFGLCFFLITLAPTLFILHREGGMFLASDRYAYLPSVGVFLLLAMAAFPLGKALVDRLPPITPLIAVVGIVILLTSLSTAQTRVWDSGETLFAHAVFLSPASVMARTALANVYREEGKYPQAFNVLKEGLRYRDDPELHIGAGYVYAATGDTPSAEEQFRSAATMEPNNPVPIFSLGSLAEQRSDAKTAQRLYEQAVALDPSYVAARVGLARMFKYQGKLDQARMQLTEALRWNPSAENARMLLEELKK